jgi:hypothetical protein
MSNPHRLVAALVLFNDRIGIGFLSLHLLHVEAEGCDTSATFLILPYLQDALGACVLVLTSSFTRGAKHACLQRLPSAVGFGRECVRRRHVGVKRGIEIWNGNGNGIRISGLMGIVGDHGESSVCGR